jgi:hypothetical protein
LGAAALMLASGLIFLAILIQPSLSTHNLTTIALAIRSPVYLSAQILFILALAFYSCSAISIYKLLSYTRDHRPAFWAMVFSVVGVGLSMPALGIKLFVFPLVGNMVLNGQAQVIDIYSSLQKFPFTLYLGVGNNVLILGLIVFTWVIWRNQGLSLLSILIFLTGWLGFVIADEQNVHAVMIAFGALIAAGGVGLGLSLWKQASTQFDPAMDRSVKT